MKSRHYDLVLHRALILCREPEPIGTKQTQAGWHKCCGRSIQAAYRKAASAQLKVWPSVVADRSGCTSSGTPPADVSIDLILAGILEPVAIGLAPIQIIELGQLMPKYPADITMDTNKLAQGSRAHRQVVMQMTS
ncbi:hypothetical protein DOTSEDRAFT_35025 [Dothistroma septosporum NZE10]|uniref:Uncharacterized protein n=1 Tax=Dothistroma septosporum (strain NZE10 / CBS 128990) TaxID=675120 RepID=N1PML2_DOTSN|nr:hypothetical protein DOTSEDRAFT_35025 [Dothistroma septosporum NZE10]